MNSFLTPNEKIELCWFQNNLDIPILTYMLAIKIIAIIVFYLYISFLYSLFWFDHIRMILGCLHTKFLAFDPHKEQSGSFVWMFFLDSEGQGKWIMKADLGWEFVPMTSRLHWPWISLVISNLNLVENLKKPLKILSQVLKVSR